jgi:hypothetical protein
MGKGERTMSEQQFIITVDGEIAGLTNYYGHLSEVDARAVVKYFKNKTREVIGMKEANK